MKIVLDAGAIKPTRSHEADAGYDLYARESRWIPAQAAESFNTGVHFEIPIGYFGNIKSRSGLNCKHDLTCEGVIDSGYVGSVIVRLRNHGEIPYYVHSGDRIAQIIFQRCEDFELEIVDSLDETERGNNGFGSTGK